MGLRDVRVWRFVVSLLVLLLLSVFVGCNSPIVSTATAIAVIELTTTPSPTSTSEPTQLPLSTATKQRAMTQPTSTPTVVSVATSTVEPTATIGAWFACDETTGIEVLDCTNLIMIFGLLEGEDWQYPEGSVAWLSNLEPCGWYGVTCVAERVVGLALNEMGLVGELPVGLLAGLERLERLKLYGNRLEGEISAEIKTLTNLRTLDLSNNNLTGTIPAEIGQLPNLEALNLNYNQLSGSVPTELWEARLLGWIDLSNNQLTGDVPADLPQVGYLNLDGNDVTIADPIVQVVTPLVVQPSPMPIVQPTTTVTAVVPTNTPETEEVIGELVPLPSTVEGMNGRYILRFSADKSPVSQGDQIILSWQTQGADHVLLSHTDHPFGVDAQPFELAANGTYTHTVSTGHSRSYVRFFLTVNEKDFTGSESSTLSVTLNCTNVWVLPHFESEHCPATAAQSSTAIGQQFQSGLMLWVEADNTIYVFKDAQNSYGPSIYERYDNTYAGGAINVDPAPNGMFVPTAEIGWVWSQQSHLKGAIGYAIEQPIQFTTQQQSAAYSEYNGEPQTYIRTQHGNTIRFYRSTYGRSSHLYSFWHYIGVPILPERPAAAFDCGDVTEIPITECNALVDFVNAGGGVQGTQFDWFSDSSPCSWEGVECTDGHITRLSLIGYTFNGTLTPSIGNLSELNHLFLATGGLRGELPIELTKLTKLARLYLADNQFSGDLPAWLGEMSALKIVELADNPLTGSIPSSFGNLSNLEMLNLGTTRISGVLPAELGNLSELHTLVVGQTMLAGTIPQSFTRLTKLQNLRFDTTDICTPSSGAVYDWLQTVPYLEGSGKVCGASEGVLAPNEVNFDCTIVTTIPVWECEALVGIYEKMGGSEWYFQGNWFTPNPCEWQKVDCRDGHVVQLEWARHGLKGQIAPEFGRFSHLTTLNLSQNEHLSGNIPPALGQLTQLVTLEIDGMSIPNQGLSGTLPPELGNLANLQRFDVSNNQLTGRIPDSFGRLHNLQFLDVSVNRSMSGALPQSLTQLTNLRHLDASYTFICAPDNLEFRQWLQTVPQIYGELPLCQ